MGDSSGNSLSNQRKFMTKRFFAVVFCLLLSTPLLAAEEKPKKSDTVSGSTTMPTNQKKNDEYAWKSMFDGKSLENWSNPKFGGDGEISVEDGAIVIGMGAMITGIKYEKIFPKIDYEIQYEAMRTQGHDFFAALTFPFDENCCTLINGGWGGGVTGLSCVDGLDASENGTGDYFSYRDHEWYRFRIRVTGKRIQVWVTETKKGEKPKENRVVDLETEGKKISLRDETSDFKPLGFCSWVTEGKIRNIKYRKLKPEEVEAKSP